MPTSMFFRALVTLAAVAGATVALIGCDSAGPTATAIPASHEKTIDVIRNNPNMPEAAKRQAISRMQQADKEAGFMPTRK
ncbi:MAG: hypothetical protein ACYC96_07000 [Fimbriimonadaceae bacterium]